MPATGLSRPATDTTGSSDPPWSVDEASLARSLGVDPEIGLDSEQARQRLVRDGPNRLRTPPRTSRLALLGRQFKSPVVWLLVIAATLSAALGEIAGLVAIAVVLVINTAVGYATELRARRSMETLRRLVVRNARVRRDGVTVEIDATLLVAGDIVLLEAGATGRRGVFAGQS